MSNRSTEFRTVFDINAAGVSCLCWSRLVASSVIVVDGQQGSSSRRGRGTGRGGTGVRAVTGTRSVLDVEVPGSVLSLAPAVYWTWRYWGPCCLDVEVLGSVLSGRGGAGVRAVWTWRYWGPCCLDVEVPGSVLSLAPAVLRLLRLP